MTGPPAPTVSPDDSPRAKRRAIEQLEPRERRWALAATLGAAVFAVVIYLTETHDRHFHPTKGQLQPETTLVLGLAAALLLAASTFYGRRAPVAFVSLFAFLIFSNGGGFVVGIPFVVLGGWLLYRSFKNQRAANATPRDTARPSTRPSSAAVKPTSARERPAPTRGGKKASAPVANKRYTPKRPPPPAPKPSRRERKAAEAKE
jgi:hypothetical protein